VNRAPDWFVTNVMGRLAHTFTSWPCKEGTVQAFWDCLADLPRADIERAAVQHCANSTAWPTPAHLRSPAKEADQNAMSASEAWDEMYRHRHAHTVSPKWSSEAVARAAQAVNWNEPSWLTEQLPTIRAQFERYYTAVAKRTEKREQHNEALALLEKSVVKDAKELYGKDYMREEEEAAPSRAAYEALDE
jgi:hypothetical protein